MDHDFSCVSSIMGDNLELNIRHNVHTFGHFCLLKTLIQLDCIVFCIVGYKIYRRASSLTDGLMFLLDLLTVFTKTREVLKLCL